MRSFDLHFSALAEKRVERAVAMTAYTVQTSLLSQLPPSQRLSALRDISENLQDLYPCDESLSTAHFLISCSGYSDPQQLDRGLNEINENVLRWSLRSVQSCHDEDQMKKLVYFCSSHKSVLDFVLEYCDYLLSKQSCEPDEPDESDKSSSYLRASWEPSPHTQPCMRFVRILFSVSSIQSSSRSWNIFCALLRLSGCSMQKIATSSCDAAFTMTFAMNPKHYKPQNKELASVWQNLEELLERTNPRWSRNHGLSILLQLIESGSISLAPSHPWQARTGHSFFLQRILQNGTPEQQKLALTILQLSTHLANGRQNFSQEAKDFTKFMALYETIVVARYINQVQECVSDFSSLIEPPCGVDSSWIVALLSAALSPSMQDSVRKVIGAWALQKSEDVLLLSGKLGVSFLIEKLLPWASLGVQFTSSVRRLPSSTLVCHHGEILSLFIQRLLNNCADEELMMSFVRANLTFVDVKGCYILSSARAFILDGLVKSLTRPSSIAKLESDCVDRITRIASLHGFQEIAENLVVTQCAHLAALSPQDMNQDR